ncbi:hypothetical protein QWZ08_13805 [Ferruginibacter paludis]|uniref:hypothetical protein n=1 Tax=Ferruginibacter paludis TaxID=1310417 RepID=UPI0025B2B39E|nr:hypothetical protein [Ferruginibacter paludis]MDN3656715.1 hypothetical protein [Ferruginibacter paludis]
MPTKENIKKITMNRNAALQAITGQLQTALTGLKEQIGEKKFEKRIKKAAKLLVAGFKDTPEKKTMPAVKKVHLSVKKPTKAVEKAAPKAKKGTGKAAKNKS